MAKMKLFQYAIVHSPRETRDAMGNDTTGPSALIVEPAFLLARDEKEAALRVARLIPDDHLAHLDEIEVVIRPF